MLLQDSCRKTKTIVPDHDVTHDLIMNSVLRYIALEPNIALKKSGKLDGKVRYVQEKTVLKLNLKKLDCVRPEFCAQNTQSNSKRHTLV